jgi:hypothetical protein
LRGFQGNQGLLGFKGLGGEGPQGFQGNQGLQYLDGVQGVQGRRGVAFDTITNVGQSSLDITVTLETTNTSVTFSETSGKQSSFFWITGFKSIPSDRFQVVDLYSEEISGTWHIKGTIFNEVPGNATTSVTFTVYYTYFYTPVIEGGN